ncbi:hypothetical protein Plano_1702 [Planococcus sp. PAMC 21323]|nr:hypothetical protein Plano_1702 [Planococcus sp. PAMC 21323]
MKNKKQVQYVSKQLTIKGFSHAFDWTKHERASTIKELQKIGVQEKMLL